MVFTSQKNAEGEFVCIHCGKTAKLRSTMNMHYNAKHSGDLPHECKICNKRFLQKQSLDLHMQVRHVNETQKQFPCPVPNCYFAAHTSGNRLIHFMRKHCCNQISNIKDGNHCKACQKEFNSSTAFYYHASSCIDGCSVPHLQEVLIPQ